jgi:DNA-binding beta-propeller fold protein YncE
MLMALLPLALLVGPAQAAAAANHPFLFQIAKWQVEPFVYEELEGPCGIGLDPSGNLYVGDYYHDQVAVFGPGGGHIVNLREEETADGPCGVAVAPSGRIYVNNYDRNVVSAMPQPYPPGSGGSWSPRQLLDSGHSTGLALDPASGRLYVDDRTYVAVYEAPAEPGAEPVEKIGLGSLGDGYGIAISSYPGTAGLVYVPDAATNTVKVYDPATSTKIAEIDGGGTPEGGFSSLRESSAAVDPTDGHVFVVDNLQPHFYEHPEATVDEFNAAGDYRGQLRRLQVAAGPTPLIHGEPATGLAVGPTGNLYVTSGNTESARLYAFGPSAPSFPLQVEELGSGLGTIVSEPAGIDCGGACAAEFTAGTEVTLTANPDPHSSFEGWSGACSGTGACRVTVSEARSATAAFAAIPQQPLTVSVGGTGAGSVVSEPAGIACPASCTETYNEGSTVTLAAAPDAHNRFVGWAGPDCNESVQQTCQITMSAAKAIAAEFAPIPQQALSVAVSGEGAVTGATGIACPSDCSEQFDEGAVVTLEAAPAAHHRLATWSGCDFEPSPGECQVTMGAQRSVMATFVPVSRQLRVSVVGAGSVSADVGGISGCGSGGPCSATYVDGETVLLSAAPTLTSTFLGWTGGVCRGIGTCEVAIGADTSLTAEFGPAVLPPKPFATELKVRRLRVRGARGTLQVRVSGPGAILATGSGLARAYVHSKGPETLTVPLGLSSSGRHKLERSRSARLRISVSLKFSPRNGGAPAFATEVVSFHARPKHPRRGRR